MAPLLVIPGPTFVIPAQAGIHAPNALHSRLLGNDGAK